MAPFISILPNELLLYILRMAILDIEGSQSAVINKTVTLTWINSLWRNLLINYPTLWAHIRVNLNPSHWMDPSSSSQHVPSYFRRVYTFLARSDQSPIKLALSRKCYSLSVGEVKSMEMNWLLMRRLLEPHLHRCSSLSFEFEGPKELVSADLLQLLECSDFPLLQHLDLKKFSPHSPCDENGGWGVAWKLSPPSTPIQTLTFHEPTLSRYLPKALDVSWPCLSSMELRISRAFWRNACDTLAQLPALRLLSLDLLPSRRSLHELPEASQERVQLNVLERISTNNLMIWHDICTPALSSITITYVGPYAPLSIRRNVPTTSVLYPSGEDRESSDVSAILSLMAELPIREVIFSDGPLSAWVIPLVLGVTYHVQTIQLHRGYYHNVLQLLCLQREHNPLTSDITDALLPWAGMLPMSLPELKTVIIHQPYPDRSIDPDRSHAVEAIFNRLRALSIDVKWGLSGNERS
ncbi:hypothetical protein DL93DRAFT_1097493 [Clavulina sp. PMI_390]|nr:hypothetical protein DL93DRAFT_1097493 [Clavulina sp. PMI_390]